MIRYLVLKEPRPGVVEDLRIEVADVENETEERYEGGISSPRTYFARAKYYWTDFPTRKEAEAYREPFVVKYWSGLVMQHGQQIAEMKKVLEQGKND